MFVLFDKAFHAASGAILVFFSSSSSSFVKGQSVKRSEKTRGGGDGPGVNHLDGHSDVVTSVPAQAVWGP